MVAIAPRAYLSSNSAHIVLHRSTVLIVSTFPETSSYLAGGDHRRRRWQVKDGGRRGPRSLGCYSYASFAWGQLRVATLAEGATVNSMTALQQHVSFFDRNKDGIITPNETLQGFLALGSDAAFATSAAAISHTLLGPLTNPPGAKLPHINVHVAFIHQAMHGSDTGAFDKKGRFVSENFDKIFKEHARSKPNALNTKEIEKMLIANRDILNPQSWVEAEAEWHLIHHLAKDKDGYLHKDAVRGIYDGSIFVQLEKRRQNHGK
ncbi:hypothetical protein ACP4OV_017413 [Aristida adscensionis]